MRSEVPASVIASSCALNPVGLLILATCRPPATTGQRSLHALEAVSQRIRRGAPVAPSISESSAPSTTSDEPPAAAPQEDLDEPKTNELVWARWESLDGRRLLIVGYYGGSVQMWDVTDLDLVHEVLHLTGMFTRSYPRTAHVLSKPPCSHDVAADLFTRSRPLMALLLENAELVLYSLATHNIVKRVTSLSNSISSVSECDMQTGELFVAISTLVSFAFLMLSLRLLIWFRPRIKMRPSPSYRHMISPCCTTSLLPHQSRFRLFPFLDGCLLCLYLQLRSTRSPLVPCPVVFLRSKMVRCSLVLSRWRWPLPRVGC